MMILNGHGRVEQQVHALDPPGAGSPWFGWIDHLGQPLTIRIDSIQAVIPKDERTFNVVLANSGIVAIRVEDAARLLKGKLGWRERSQIETV